VGTRKEPNKTVKLNVDTQVRNHLGVL